MKLAPLASGRIAALASHHSSGRAQPVTAGRVLGPCLFGETMRRDATEERPRQTTAVQPTLEPKRPVNYSAEAGAFERFLRQTELYI